VKTPREEAIGRLGGPHCAHCGALGAPQVRVSGEETPFDDISVRDCCSATCAVALLDEMWKGLARIINRKRGGVIAGKQANKQMGIWPRGHNRIAVERRKAERKAARDARR
jgi:hypothetical protein